MTCEAVFILKRDIPIGVDPSVLDICYAAEKVSGPETIVGAQQIRGLWRIYPTAREHRTKLILNGIDLAGIHLTILARNPYIVNDDDGSEIPVTKLWISDIPISVANDDIETMLGRFDVKFRSKMVNELVRRPDGGLTRFLSGRRYVFINLPTNPLPRESKVGRMTCKLYYKEMPKDLRFVKCKRCFNYGHYARDCENEVVCTACGGEGHMRGSCDVASAGDMPVPVGPAASDIQEFPPVDVNKTLRQNISEVTVEVHNAFDALNNVNDADIDESTIDFQDCSEEFETELEEGDISVTATSSVPKGNSGTNRQSRVDRGRGILRASRSGSRRGSANFVRDRSDTPSKRLREGDSPTQPNTDAKKGKPGT